MPQTLRSTISLPAVASRSSGLVPRRHYTQHASLEALLAALQQYISQLRNDLLSPRRKSIDAILREAFAR